MYELAQGFANKGHGVTVLTSFPAYNLAEARRQESIEEVSYEQTGLVLRARTMRLKKVNYLRRGLAELTLPWNLWRLLRRHAKGFDVTWVFSPPLTLALLGGFMKKKYKAVLVMNVQDIFPQNAVDLGIMRNPGVVFWYERLERMAYEYSDHIIVHSGANKEFLVNRKGVPARKVIMQYNWVDVGQFDRAKGTGLFRERFRLGNRIVVLFAGVFGPSQGLEFVIELAAHFRDDSDVVFLLVGDGSERAYIASRVEELGLVNVQLEPFVSREEYPYLAKDADIGLVCLSSRVKTPVVPGKIQGYMAAGLPIVGILNKESDGHQLIRESGAGFTVSWGDKWAAVEALIKLKSSASLRQRLGRSGHEYALRNLSRSDSIERILELVSEESSN
jgi:glycosyltransferase involved in cell wall biosynthesis